MSSTQEQLSILLVEDNPAHARLIQRALQQSPMTYVIEVTQTLSAARAVLESRTPDLVVVDMNLPDGSGLELLPGGQTLGDYPVLVMTSQGDERAAVSAMHLGALDYAAKSEHFFAELPRIIQRALRQWNHIIERRVAEQTARRSEKRLAAILDASVDAIVSVDQDQIIQIFNKGAEAAFGYASHEVLGKHIEMLVPERYRGAHHQIAAAYIQRGESRRMEGSSRVVALRKDGTEFPAHATLSRVELDDGVVVTLSLRDVTQQLQREAALHHALRMEAVGHLTGGVAHDFNNIQGVILANISMLLEDEELMKDRDVRDAITDSYEAAERGATLVRRLLTFARGEDSSSAQVVRLDEVVHGLRRIISASLGAAIELRIEASEGVWPCELDLSQLENALLNLCVNARDAMPGGGVLKIKVINLPREDARVQVGQLRRGDHVMLSVEDTGHGMSEDVIAQAFLPFFSTKQVGEGTGFGLSMVHSFVDRAGGRVWIESRVGEGTTISMCLPRSETQEGVEGESAVVASDERPQNAQPPISERLTVLIVDDEAPLRRTARRMFGHLGFECVEASASREALGLLERDASVDLVFCDQLMPGELHGLGFLGIVQRRWPHINVLLTTGRPDLVKHSEIPVISKPYVLDELRSALAGLGVL